MMDIMLFVTFIWETHYLCLSLTLTQYQKWHITLKDDANVDTGSVWAYNRAVEILIENFENAQPSCEVLTLIPEHCLHFGFKQGCYKSQCGDKSPV